MRIAQVAPLYESVPPQGYGGTERVVANITEELVCQGHEVTLFASADSVTSAELRPMSPRSLRLDADCIDQLAHHVYMMEQVIKDSGDFDLIHNHVDYLIFPLARRCRVPVVTTLHGRLDIPDLVPVYREFSEQAVVSISDSQRTPLPFANWVGTVYHGLPVDEYRFHEGPGDYLAFLGRISPEKRCDWAIEIATRAGMPLKIAAKVDKTDRDYFEAEIKPLLEQPGVEFLGEVGGREKSEFLGNAQALLFPIDWPEPFGLVMIEAMACGTPVIARRRGSVPEVVTHGETGFIIDDVDEGVRAVQAIAGLDRRACRAGFEKRFTAPRMAGDYVRIYEQMAPQEMSVVA
ncbi:MAG: glycosyltransferase family 4 protein [Candidatus Hydrogenedentales bacterium]